MLLLALAAAAPGACSADAGPDARETQVVLWPLISDGTEFRRVSYPRQVDTIRVLADTPVVLEARRTEVYYWPITREYLADLTARNEPVTDDIRIVDAAGTGRVVLARPYSVWYPDGVPAGGAQLLFDEQALSGYRTYVAEARAAADVAREYQRLRAEHERAVSRWLQQVAAKVDPLPPPPAEFTLPEPAPYRGFATEPAEAPIVSLPAGEYRIELIGPDGAVTPGGARRLVAFGPRRKGVGFAVVPASRWTQPLTAFDPAETIYVSGESDIYLEPVIVEEFDAAHFRRLLRPQSVEAPDPDRYFWSPREPVVGASLEVDRDDGPPESVAQAGYRVAQVTGRERGYTIVPQAAGDPGAPDLTAMHLRAGGLDEARVRVVVDGQLMTGSERAVRAVHRIPEWLLYLPALFPILVALGWRFRPRRRRA